VTGKIYSFLVSFLTETKVQYNNKKLGTLETDIEVLDNYFNQLALMDGVSDSNRSEKVKKSVEDKQAEMALENLKTLGIDCIVLCCTSVIVFAFHCSPNLV